MTTQDWKDLITMREVAEAQHNRWEIHTSTDERLTWFNWTGEVWEAECIYRGRPKHPELCGAWAGNGLCILPKGHNMGKADIPKNHKSGKRTVTSECWRNKQHGGLSWGTGYTNEWWQRFPAGDITGEVEE